MVLGTQLIDLLFLKQVFMATIKLFKIIRCSILWLLIFYSSVSLAQKGNGKLTGKVTDSSTTQGLSGVTIAPGKSGSKGVASINDGSYILTLQPGTYSVRYSYTGYVTKGISEIIIRSGETTFMDVMMVPSLNTMTDVVVTSSAKKEAQSAVYNRQRITAAASDGISQELISKTPDIDGGQVLKRITGVSVQNDKFVVVRGLGAQYNQTMLNGVAMTSTETNQNAFSFDLIPAAVIDNIVVNKTATPDMPGNFAGGVVQVNTKDFPSKNFISIALQGGFSDKTYGKDFYADERGKLDWLSFGGEGRDLPPGFPTTLDRANIGNLNKQERIRSLKTLKNNLAPISQGASMPNENIQLGFGKTIRLGKKNQFGIVAAFTQRKSELIERETSMRDPEGFTAGTTNVPRFKYFSDNTRYKYSSELAAVINLAYSFGNNKITFKNLYSNVFRNSFVKRDSVYTTLLDNFPDGTRVEGFAYIIEQRSLLNSILSGEHKLGAKKETQFDWNVNVTRNNSEFPDTRNFLMSYTGVGPEKRYTTADKGISLVQILGSSSRLWSKSTDLITGGAFNLSTIFNIAGNKQIVKGGVLFQNRQRSATGTALPYVGVNKYSIDSVLSPVNYSEGLDILIANDLTDQAGNYAANTSLQAVFESIENKIGKKLRIIWGVRFENYQQSINVFKPVFNPNFRYPELVPSKFESRNTSNFLPSVNIIFSPVKAVNFRGAVSKTVIRPDLKDLAQFTRFDFQSFQLTTGNPDLKNTLITNYDLKFEWFPSAGEIVSFAAFYKKMLDPIEYGQVTAENNVIGRLAINSGEATVNGVEFEMRKKMNFIPFAPWMQHVTLFSNGSLLKSQVEDRIIYNPFFDFSPSHRLTGQPNYIINGGVSISAFNNSFEATFTYNRSGDYINQLGSSDFVANPVGKPLLLVPHFWVQARDIIDIGVRQSFLKNKAQIKLNISNILSKPLIIYQDFDGDNKLGTPFKIDSRYGAGEGMVLSGVDNVSSLTIGQRTFFLSFSYTF